MSEVGVVNEGGVAGDPLLLRRCVMLRFVNVPAFLSRDLIFDPFQCLDSCSRTGHSSNLMNALCAICPDERFS